MINIKLVIGKLEQLSVDTQPVRDYLQLANAGKIQESSYLGFFENLNRELSRPYKAKSSPIAINLMMKQLDKRLKTDKYNSTINSSDSQIDAETVRQIIKESITGIERTDTKEMVDILRSLMGDIQVIKDKSFLVGDKSSSSDNSSIIDEERVFVDPLDNKKVESIKSYVNISSTQGSNISVALDKLKKLKKQ